MPNKTNTELLEIILKQSKDNARNQLDFASKVSIFMNEQNLVNAEIKGYLESNERTKQKGLVEQVKENTNDIYIIKTDKKVDKAKVSLIGAIIGALLAFLGKIFF